MNHRRYEALRAFFTEGLTYEQAGARFGYTRWAMINLVRQHRAGRLELFAPPKKPGPPPGIAPAKDRARGRVIELRRQGLSAYEISRRLAAEDTPLNRTSVGEILAEEGFGRLDKCPGLELVVVGDEDGGLVPAQPGDDQLADRAGVAGQLHNGVLVQYARRMTIEQRLAEIIRAFCADALSSTVNLNVDLDVMLAVLAQALIAALRARLPGYSAVTPDTIQRRFLETPGQLITTPNAVTVRLERRAFSPVLRKADLPPTTPVPWWGGRPIRYEIT